MMNGIPRSSVDAVVIGGGIAGCAAAYELARSGLSTTLVEKGAIGYEQSTRNWGWVHQQVRYPHLIPLGVQSVRIWNHLAEELKSDVGWIQGGNLSLGFDPADLEDFETWHKDAAQQGLETRLLSREKIKELLPELRGEWTSGLYIPSDGQANPDLVTQAYANAAEAMGASIHSECSALKIDVTGGKVSGVLTERGQINAPIVVCAAGAWSSRLLRTIGVHIPQRAVRSTVVRTTPVSPLTKITAWGDGVTFRQDHLGRFILAGGASSIYDLDGDLLRDFKRFLPLAWRNRRWVRMRVGKRLLADLGAMVPGTKARREFWQRRRRIDPPPDHAAVKRSLQRFQEMFPSLEIGVDRSWAGYIDSTPDQAPVLGAIDKIPGLHILTGLSGHGFALGPGAAQLLADLITGNEPSVDPKPFRYQRFAENDLAPVHQYRR